MYVLKHPRVIFLAHARTASQSIVKYLEENYQVSQMSSRPNFPLLWGDHHSIDLVNWGDMLQRRYETFCVVRNHWDWVLSVAMFGGGIPKGDPSPAFLEQWIETKLNDYLYIQQVPDPWGNRWNVERSNRRAFWLYPQLSDHVLKFESLKKGIGELFGTRDVNLPKIGTTNRTAHVSEYYTELAKELVYHQFEDEIKEYGYEFPEATKVVKVKPGKPLPKNIVGPGESVIVERELKKVVILDPDMDPKLVEELDKVEPTHIAGKVEDLPFIAKVVADKHPKLPPKKITKKKPVKKTVKK